MFVGFGYDIHRLKKGLRLVLGGVEIAHTHGLDGHSDADVLTHAVMDAMLGAAGLEDIGHLFPNTDPRHKNASSLRLLEAVTDRIVREGLKVVNVDATLIAEQPLIGPHIPQMKKNLSAKLGIPEARIGIKATTNEQLGALGRGEGIAAMAIASLAGK
jgi:2-C-methyl-D-erythritol 2,4-cyclodiphosphate synthase